MSVDAPSAVAPSASTDTQDQVVSQTPIVPDPNGPPAWKDIVASDAYRKLGPGQAMSVFTNWVKDSQAYIDGQMAQQNQQGGFPDDPRIVQKTQQQFNTGVNDIADKEFGRAFPINAEGRLETIGDFQ